MSNLMTLGLHITEDLRVLSESKRDEWKGINGETKG